MAQNLLARALPNQLAAPVDRYINGILWPGVWDLAGGHFRVVAQAAPGMSVRCGSGAAGDMAVVEGAAALSGRYIVQNQDAYVGSSNTDLSIGNGDPSGPRIDLIVLRVYDDEMDSSGLTVARLEVVPGIPASSPAAPATPAGALALAQVLVGVGESVSITAGDITDLRVESVTRGQFVERVKFTATAPFVKANYPWLRHVRIRLVAGGGGGQGNASATNARGGNGGGAGGAAEALVAVASLAASETVTVGAGGAGGYGTATGVNGGTTSFGTHAVATGGTGGRTTAVQAGGVGTSGDLLIQGGGGGAAAQTVQGSGGSGGSSHLAGGGSGAPARTIDSDGKPGGQYGGGGGGGYRNTADVSGGAGANGIVIVELFA